jgi:hypothetical protein
MRMTKHFKACKHMERWSVGKITKESAWDYSSCRALYWHCEDHYDGKIKYKIVYSLSNCVATLSVSWCMLLCPESECTVHNFVDTLSVYLCMLLCPESDSIVHNWNLKLKAKNIYFQIQQKILFQRWENEMVIVPKERSLCGLIIHSNMLN